MSASRSRFSSPRASVAPRIILSAFVALAALVPVANAEANVLVAVSDGAYNGVATFDDALSFVSQTTVPGPVTVLATQSDGSFYTAIGNTIAYYTAGGALVDTVAAPSTTTISALDYLDGFVFAGITDGGYHAVARLTGSLGYVSQVTVASPVTAVAAGDAGSFYLASGSSVAHYAADDTLINAITAASTTTFTALDYLDGRLFAGASDGAFDGVIQFDAALDFESVSTTPGAVSGVAAGGDGSYYTALTGGVDHFDASGNLLTALATAPTTQTPALSFFSTVPEPPTLLLAGSGLVALMGRRRRASPY